MQPYQLGSTEWIKQELAGLFGQQVTMDLTHIIRLYGLYDGPGQRWDPNKGLDYKPTVKRTNYIKKLIDDEARYMMGVEPEIKILAKEKGGKDAAAQIEDWLSDFLRRQRWGDKLIKGARDCFIGKRVALKLTGRPGGKLSVQFRPSLEFVYDTDPEDVDRLSKVVFFYHTNESDQPDKQRIWRQRYEMVEGRCYVTEGIYNGHGAKLEETHSEEDTGLDFIPVFVIVNDGLTGDMTGTSDVETLFDDQDAYNRLKSDNIDALRFNMFPMRVIKDADQKTVDNIKIAPGALIDMQTDPASVKQAAAEILEAKFGYNDCLENALNRHKNDMFSLLSVPNVSLEQLKGFATSGKAMRALYWDLESRCEEKWNVWDAALIWMTDALIRMAKIYGTDKLPEIEYKVAIEHRYPITGDEDAERQVDMQEVSQQVRSRKSYIDKWMPDADADSELEEIIKEQAMLGDTFARALDTELEAGDVQQEKQPESEQNEEGAEKPGEAPETV